MSARRHALTSALNFGAGLAILTLALLASGTSAASLSSTESTVEPRPSRAEVLVERFGCWTGDAPKEHAGEIPSGAIVTLPGERAGLVPAAVGFEIWQEDRPGVLRAFCAGDEVEEALR